MKGSFKDVELKRGSLEELSEVVLQWLGSPGAWQLCSVANWPLSEEALQLPSSAQCPLVVHVWNSQDKLLSEMKGLKERLERIQEKVKEEFKRLDRETERKVDRLEEEMRKVEAHLYLCKKCDIHIYIHYIIYFLDICV